MSRIKIIDQELRLEMMEMMKEVFNGVMDERENIKEGDTDVPTFPADKLFKGAPLMQMDLKTRNKPYPEWKLKYFKYKNEADCYDKQGLLETHVLASTLKPVYRVDGFWDYTRLPTAEESPRNVWLVPHKDLTKNLFTYCSTILVRYSSNDIRVEHYVDSPTKFLNNSNIEAIMMVSSLKIKGE